MSTAIIVEANSGCPVQVTQIIKALAGGATHEQRAVVPAGESDVFYLRAGCDLHLSELPPPIAAAPPDP